jgi:hypothetical protein
MPEDPGKPSRSSAAITNQKEKRKKYSWLSTGQFAPHINDHRNYHSAINLRRNYPPYFQDEFHSTVISKTIDYVAFLFVRIALLGPRFLSMDSLSLLQSVGSVERPSESTHFIICVRQFSLLLHPGMRHLRSNSLMHQFLSKDQKCYVTNLPEVRFRPEVRRVALGHVSDDCLMNLLKDLSSFPDDDAFLLVQIIIPRAGQYPGFVKLAIIPSHFALTASIEMITSSFNIEAVKTIEALCEKNPVNAGVSLSFNETLSITVM